MIITHLELLGQVFVHPDLGWCLYDNSGAATSANGDNAYSATQGPASCLVQTLLSISPPPITAELASDGWYWRIKHPWQYGLD